ncbi:MAG: TonB-dependent receptor [Gammaproteobacteria bacterium]|nr:TonB-dependent receptor [Gammaproteobacteria bacterium]
MTIKTLLFTMLSSLSACLYAAEADIAETLTEDYFLADIPIVLSASRLSQPQNESASTVTIISRQMIEASTATSLPELMRMVPGFQVGFYDGNIPVVTYHGMSGIYSRRIQVLIDGRSVYIPTWGGVPWKSLPITLDEIEQIEVTRGPNAAAYGANSFLAVISIKTFNAFDTQGHLLKIANGNNKQHQLLYRIGAQTEKTDFRVTMSHRGDEGLDDFADSYDEELLKLRLDYAIDDSSQFFYQTGINKNLQEEQGGGTTLTHMFETSVSYHHFKWESNLDSQSSISLQYYMNKHKIDNRSLSSMLTGADIGLTGVDDFQVLIDFSSESKRQDIELNYFNKPSNILRTVSGFSFRHDSVESAGLFNTSNALSSDVSRVFGHAEWTITPTFILNTGLMAEDHEISNTSYSPRIALTHKISNQQSLRLSYSTANRAPSVVEENMNIVYYPSLIVSGTGGLGICDPILAIAIPPPITCITNEMIAFPFKSSPGGLDFEKIKSSEIGYYSDYLNHRININGKIFHDEISDIIVDISANEDGGFDNAQTLVSEGIELDASYQPEHSFRIGFNYSNIKMEDKVQDGISTVEVFSNTAPKESYGLNILKQFKNQYSISLEYYQIGEMRWADVSKAVEEFDILNLKLSKKTKIGNSTLTTSLLLKNISGDYNDYNEYSNVAASNTSIMSDRILLTVELQGF